MVYNKQITNVIVYVANVGSKDAVDSALQTLIMDWSQTSYPPVCREFISSYTIEDLPPRK